MYHFSGERNSQSVTHQCVTHRLLVISQSALFRRLPRYERDGERGRERTETYKDGGREGRMDIWIEGRTKNKEIMFSYSEDIFLFIWSHVHI